MIRGMYTAASGALAAQAQVDAIANNLANVNTAGFKRQLVQMQSQPMRDVYRYQTDPSTSSTARMSGVATAAYVGKVGSGVQIYDTPNNFEQGPIAQTGSDTDVALAGPGFFAVRDGNGGLAYTRDGQFVRDAQGVLRTQTGDAVLSAAGNEITLPDTGKLEIGRDGTVAVGGVPVDKLGLVEFGNTAALRAQGEGRYVDTGAAVPAAATQTTALQGSLEKSNADVVHSMVDMIAAERWFDANTKVIQTEDSATGVAIQTVGRTNS